MERCTFGVLYGMLCIIILYLYIGIRMEPGGFEKQSDEETRVGVRTLPTTKATKTAYTRKEFLVSGGATQSCK